MDQVIAFLQSAGAVLGVTAMYLLCLAGLVISCLSISGTWLVVGAAALGAWLSGPEFPGWLTIVVFAVLSGLVEGAEAISSAWGVQKRGGSGWAGFAALVGGLLGLFLGAAIPIPVLGSLLGMLVGSFGFAYFVEYLRLKKVNHAAHIAFGAVIARLLVIILKVGATLGMSVYLLVGFHVG